MCFTVLGKALTSGSASNLEHVSMLVRWKSNGCVNELVQQHQQSIRPLKGAFIKVCVSPYFLPLIFFLAPICTHHFFSSVKSYILQQVNCGYLLVSEKWGRLNIKSYWLWSLRLCSHVHLHTYTASRQKFYSFLENTSSIAPLLPPQPQESINEVATAKRLPPTDGSDSRRQPSCCCYHHRCRAGGSPQSVSLQEHCKSQCPQSDNDGDSSSYCSYCHKCTSCCLCFYSSSCGGRKEGKQRIVGCWRSEMDPIALWVTAHTLHVEQQNEVLQRSLCFK